VLHPSILLLATSLLDDLWLGEPQCAALLRHVATNPPRSSHGAYLRNKLKKHIVKRQEILKQSKEWIYSHGIKRRDWEIHARQCAEILSYLEIDLRRTDPVGECLRWLTPPENREFGPFPERVRPLVYLIRNEIKVNFKLQSWVMRTIMGAPPEDMERCYKYFYKVAKVHLFL
jgi:hypothetical protein